jgi:hypothetical protein
MVLATTILNNINSSINYWGKGCGPSKLQMGDNCPVTRKCFLKACTWPVVWKEAENFLIMG